MKLSQPMRGCGAKTRSGSPCAAVPAPGSEFCPFHDPANTAAQREARREGGRRRSQPRAAVPPDAPDVTITGVKDVCALLTDTINHVRKGTLDGRIANTVGYLASVLIRALEVGDLEARLAALEAATRSTQPPPSTMYRSYSNGEGA